MKRIRKKINGISTQFYIWGNPRKPKIFFLHGWMDTGASFHFLCEHLQRDYFCVAPDLRGFARTGHSQSPLGYHFYEYIADLYQIFLRWAPGERIRLAGHSMGGNIASLYAGTFSQQVSYVINMEGIGPQGLPYTQAPERLKTWVEELFQSGEPGFRVYPTKKEISLRLAKANPHLSAKQISFLLPFLSKKVRGGFCFSSDPRHKFVHPYLTPLEQYFSFWEKIKAKCLVITAEKTNLGRWLKNASDVHQEMDSRFSHFPPDTKRIMLADCGHMLHHEKPDEVATLIREFIAEN